MGREGRRVYTRNRLIKDCSCRDRVKKGREGRACGKIEEQRPTVSKRQALK